MIRVVFDTNVVISALIYPDGLQHQVLKLGLEGHASLYASRDLVLEYERVLREPRLDFPKPVVRSFLRRLNEVATMVEPMRRLSECPDEDDNRVLECADAARAGFLVTGNKQHFPERWKQTQIVNGREFLELAFPGSTRKLRARKQSRH
ncbi:MAG: putative toxin-antitoxin system toxin component, PIN family [Acidobacteria bacterium]|nr:putative toxin-antitoxin system toxin component, PIN family [Acidobacteriota bacterium]